MILPSQGDRLPGRREPRSAQDTSDTCRPTLCALGGTPHAHCPCGLPMATGARLCDLCRSEGFEPKPLTPADHALVWDGMSYPSFRRNRPVDVARERYVGLLQTIFDPAFEHETRPTAGEAA